MKNKTIRPFLLHKPVVIGCCCTKRGQKQEEAPAPVFIVGAAIAYNGYGLHCSCASSIKNQIKMLA